jgi:hypothetical protein
MPEGKDKVFAWDVNKEQCTQRNIRYIRIKSKQKKYRSQFEYNVMNWCYWNTSLFLLYLKVKTRQKHGRMRIWRHVRVNSMANDIKAWAPVPTGNSLGNCKLTDSDKFVQQSLANRSFFSRVFHIFPFVNLSSFAICCSLLGIHGF